MNKIEIIENKYIYFGSYPQNGTFKEPIKWRILKQEDNVLTLISDVILFNDDFDIRYSEYSKSKLRNIILNEFIPNAFSLEEMDLILETELEDCIDKVFIPSVLDIKHLSREERIRKVTPYAISKNASHYPVYSKKDLYLKHNGWYWTRTPYKPPYDPTRNHHVYYISYSGSLEERAVWGSDIGVVLMMRVKI